jgi:hypothetical protein
VLNRRIARRTPKINLAAPGVSRLDYNAPLSSLDGNVLSLENLLDLNARRELVASTYAHRKDDSKFGPARVLLARYPDGRDAATALTHFLRVYLPEHEAAAREGYASIEDGWIGFRQSGRAPALAFEAPDEASPRLCMEHSARVLTEMETTHE